MGLTQRLLYFLNKVDDSSSFYFPLPIFQRMGLTKTIDVIMFVLISYSLDTILYSMIGHGTYRNGNRTNHRIEKCGCLHIFIEKIILISIPSIK